LELKDDIEGPADERLELEGPHAKMEVGTAVLYL